MREYKLFIDGEWMRSSSGDTFDEINPATLETIGKLQKASIEDVKSAVDSADDAFGKWSGTPAPQRAKILFRAARMLDEQKEDLASLLTMEMGKVLKEARGDVQEAIDITYY